MNKDIQICAMPQNHEFWYCQHPCEDISEILQLPVNSVYCISTRFEWIFKFVFWVVSSSYYLSHICKISTSLKRSRYALFQLGDEWDTILITLKHKTSQRLGIFITGNRQGFVNFSYLVGSTAETPTKPCFVHRITLLS